MIKPNRVFKQKKEAHKKRERQRKKTFKNENKTEKCSEANENILKNGKLRNKDKHAKTNKYETSAQ